MEFIETESEVKESEGARRRSKRKNGDEEKTTIKKKTKEVEEVDGQEVDDKESDGSKIEVIPTSFVDFWVPACFCGETAKLNEKTVTRDYLFFSCPFRRFDLEAAVYKFGCKFWLKQTELDPERICGCKHPMKKWRNKAGTHDFESCVYCFPPGDSKIKTCRYFRKKLIE